MSKMDKVVIVESKLVNEYGSSYGMVVYVFADNLHDAWSAVYENYGDDYVDSHLYGSHNDVWDQVSFSPITKFDDEGNCNRNVCIPIEVMQEFTSKRIGFSTMRKIVSLLTE
jgi:hypothetical protein